MRVAHLFVALALLASSSIVAAADHERQWIIATRPPEASLSAIATTASSRDRLERRIHALGLRVIGSLEDGMPPDPIPTGRAEPRTTTGRRGSPFDLDASRIWLVEAPDAFDATTVAQALARDPEIEWFEPNQVRDAAVEALEASFPNDPHFRDTRQWGLRNVGPLGAYGGVTGADIHALEGWAWSTGGNDLRLAIADTGIDADHPDLAAMLPGGGPRIELATNVTSDPDRSVRDLYGHGTPVTGVVAALTNNGSLADSLGVAGVCGGDGRGNLGCRIVPIKISPGHLGTATSYDISRAILYATRVGARAMNLSYGGLAPSRLERLALHHAITHGCVVVAAAGNWSGRNNGDDPVYPAAYAGEGLCIQAGGSDPFDRRAYFSSHGPGLDLLAPATKIWTTFMTYPSYHGAIYNGYVAGSGTSFAAPHVTGAVGLLAALRPELMDTDFQHLLREAADDVGAPGVDPETGWGRMNVARALASVRPAMGIWHDEVAADALAPLATDSLVITEAGWGNLDRAQASPFARLLEASATVAVPDSFLDSVRVWPRVGGTTTVRGDFRLPYFAPWSRVTHLSPGSFTIAGYVYRLTDCLYCSDPEDTHLPLPPDQTRFGFTVVGRVDRPPSLVVHGLEPAIRASAGDTLGFGWEASDPDRVTAVEAWLEREDGARWLIARTSEPAGRERFALPCPPPFTGRGALRITAIDEHGRHHDRTSVTRPIEIGAGGCAFAAPALSVASAPNPFRGALRISASPGARVTVVDVAGRRVRDVSRSAPATDLVWDGRNDRGEQVPPGLYFVRCESGARRVQRKVVKAE